MKRTRRLVAVTLGVLALTGTAFTGTALADSDNWDAEKAAQIAVNRCANAGNGNGAERVARDGSCQTSDVRPEDARGDQDPGNSGDHNANNG